MTYIERFLVWSWTNFRQIALWSSWILITIILSIYLTTNLLGQDKSNFLPAETTHGHYQIEMACDACHTTFDGVKQQACLDCHAAEFEKVKDSHEESKFSDPRNASMLEQIDAQLCITCHVEHRPDMTKSMGVTLPDDFCIYCHEEIAIDRPSHEGMPFNECRDACHNYHDNSSLYEDFLAKHLHEADTFATPTTILERNFLETYSIEPKYPVKKLTMQEQDAPEHINLEDGEDWVDSSHANAGVNCMGCHENSEQDWVVKPEYTICKDCHDSEASTFLEGRHGMRLDAGLSPMTTDTARLPMKDGIHREMTCNSCHKAHKFSTNPRYMAVESCLECHADEHSKAYKASPHFRLLNEELKGQAAKGTGVSCATCHLPKEIVKIGDIQKTIVQHNQNLNLRPTQKMMRGVCMNCHGAGFSLDSLVDKELVRNNFSEQPAKHIESLDMVEKRLRNDSKKEND